MCDCPLEWWLQYALGTGPDWAMLPNPRLKKPTRRLKPPPSPLQAGGDGELSRDCADQGRGGFQHKNSPLEQLSANLGTLNNLVDYFTLFLKENCGHWAERGSDFSWAMYPTFLPTLLSWALPQDWIQLTSRRSLQTNPNAVRIHSFYQ